MRALVPRVLAGLVRRGEDFDAAEDALQEALLEALRVWPEHPPRDPRAWLTTVATRRLVDARRSEAARDRREEATYAEPRPAATEEGDDTLFLLFCCCHPDLTPASQVALTLRAVGGLTTREIADAFYVPEATMAQRISRSKRALHGRRLDQPGDLAVVLRVLYLVYSAGHAGRVDLAGEAIRLARQLTLATEEPEARGLLALMLLNHARLPARLDSEGRIVTLDRQDRGLWDTREIAEGVRVLQSALAVRTDEQRPGRYQVEAAIAALHDDAASAEETDWPQILAWYDDLVALTDDPVRQDPAAVLGRAVAVGHVLDAAAGLRETERLRDVIGDRHRWSRRPRLPARARRRPARRRDGVRRGRPPGHERRRARPPGPPGRPRRAATDEVAGGRSPITCLCDGMSSDTATQVLARGLDQLETLLRSVREDDQGVRRRARTGRCPTWSTTSSSRRRTWPRWFAVNRSTGRHRRRTRTIRWRRTRRTRRRCATPWRSIRTRNPARTGTARRSPYTPGISPPHWAGPPTPSTPRSPSAAERSCGPH